MTDVSEPIKKNQSQFHSNDKQQVNYENRQSLDQSEQQNNVLPLTHGNKKRKHRKKLRKHSPQYYQQKKVKKINRKLEKNWDSHFVNQHILDLFAKRKIQAGRAAKTLSKLVNQKRSVTAIDNAKIPGNTTMNIHPKKQSLPLPKIQKVTKRSKSFNVHAVPQKVQQQPQKLQSKLQNATKDVVQSKHLPELQQKQKRKRSSQQSKRAIVEQQKQKSHLQVYQNTLNQLFEDKKFLNCHKQVLELFFNSIERKSVRQILDKQFTSLRKKQSLIFKVMASIVNRQNFLQKLRIMAPNMVINDKPALQMIDHYRTSTLAVVQEILKWKQTWHTVYYQVFRKSKNFDLVYKTQNYLLTLMNSTDDILKNVNLQKDTKAQSIKQIRKKTEVITSHKQKTQQANKQKQVLNKSVQKQKLPTLQNQKRIQVNKNNQSSPIKQVFKTQQKVNKHESSNAKQLNKSSQIQKLTIKTQKSIQKHAQKITSNDPFLISINSIQKQDKNIILKIRACQLLLIEEQYNLLKK